LQALLGWVRFFQVLSACDTHVPTAVLLSLLLLLLPSSGCRPTCALLSHLQELWPGYHKHAPTPTHHFLRLLHEKGLLMTVFSQNVDGLEQIAGVPADKVVNAHGSFDGEHTTEKPSFQHWHTFLFVLPVSTPWAHRHR
jgi:hypothetical protein